MTNTKDTHAVIEQQNAALERIIGMCDVGPSCKCGRPNGLPAVIHCANGALTAGREALATQWEAVNWSELVKWWESGGEQWDSLKDIVLKMIATHPQASEPAPSTAGEDGQLLKQFLQAAEKDGVTHLTVAQPAQGEIQELVAALIHPARWHDLTDEQLDRAAALLQSTALPVGELTDEMIDDLRSRYTDKRESREDIRNFARAILAAAGTRPDPGLTGEQQFAIRQSHEIKSSDQYFKARHDSLDTNDRRKVFEAAFTRGWDAAMIKEIK